MGENIWGRPKSPVNRREYGPASTASAARASSPTYGVQLRAKQKLKGYYANISEKQFRASTRRRSA
jgi:small subunit ribosomal protein S4